MNLKLWKDGFSRFQFAVANIRFTFPRLFNLSRQVLLSSIIPLFSNLSQKRLIEREEWDYLIVLDGCSYEYFRKVNSIPGKLKCVISPATGTGMWAMRTWTRAYDAVYVSSNPHINHKGYARVPGLGFMKFFNPNNFLKIIEVWDGGWREECVWPETINSYVLSNFYPHMIIHYLQPHAPFIGDVRLPVGNSRKIRKWLRENNLGLDYYREAYISNLERVLEQVKELLPYLNGKVIVTSDHGYWDGTNGKICHDGYGTYLHMVPWLEVSMRSQDRGGKREIVFKEVIKEEEKQDQGLTPEEEEKIKSRLESLGYI